MIKNIFLTLVSISFLIADADHIIFSRITTTPNDAEMVSIYNPTSESINLSNYYLSDLGGGSLGQEVDPGAIDCSLYTDNGNFVCNAIPVCEWNEDLGLCDTLSESESTYYYNLPLGVDCFPQSESQFIAKFPNIDIAPNQTIKIGMHDAATFNSYYSINPDYTLKEDMLSVDVDGADSTIGTSSNILSDPSEAMILFYWDEGNSQIVQDVDYFFWGPDDIEALQTSGINKTDVDGYLDDTSFEIQVQNILLPHSEGESYIRNSNDENGESSDNGNGITGDDETSEIFIESWSIIDENGCAFIENCGCLIESDPNYDETAEESCTDINNNGYGDCCVADVITHSIEEIVTCNIDSGLCAGFTATIRGTIIGFGDYREPNNGPQVIEVMDQKSGYIIDLVVWDWDVITPIPSSIAYMVDPTNNAEYAILATGLVGLYNGSFQFEIAEEDDIEEYHIYYTQGKFIANEDINAVEILPAPFVIIPTIGERLDYSFSVPSNSKVVIRIFDMNGNFVTSLLDDFFTSAGTMERYEDKSDWDGKDHHGQIVAPGTYLMHIEATNWITGEYSFDMAPVVVGVYK